MKLQHGKITRHVLFVQTAVKLVPEKMLTLRNVLLVNQEWSLLKIDSMVMNFLPLLKMTKETLLLILSPYVMNDVDWVMCTRRLLMRLQY
jgi:hypothetical protein